MTELPVVSPVYFGYDNGYEDHVYYWTCPLCGYPYNLIFFGGRYPTCTNYLDHGILCGQEVKVHWGNSNVHRPWSIYRHLGIYHRLGTHCQDSLDWRKTGF